VLGRSDFATSRGQWSSVGLSNPRNPITINADLFLFLFRTFSIAILALVMSNNLSRRLPNPDMPKLRRTHKFDLSTLRHLCRDFGVRNIANPNATSSGLHPTKLRNGVPPVHLSHSSVAHTNPLGFRDIAYRNIAILVTMFTGLPPTKLRYGIPRVDPTALMARINGPASSEL
jgi:hypothetical protein